MAAHKAPPRANKVPEIRKGDTVVVLHGKDAGKRGMVDDASCEPDRGVKGQEAAALARVFQPAAVGDLRASTSPSATRRRDRI